jgi:hypothetical protein
LNASINYSSFPFKFSKLITHISFNPCNAVFCERISKKGAAFNPIQPWRLTINCVEEREEEKERKKKAPLEGMVSAHMNLSKVGLTARGIMRKSPVHLSYFLLSLNYVFYLYELGSHNRYAPLTYNADNRAPLVMT